MEGNGNQFEWTNETDTMAEGLESISEQDIEEENHEVIDEDNDEFANVESVEGEHVEGAHSEQIEEYFNIDSVEDIVSLDLKGLGPLAVRNLEFGSLEIANEFYNWYARTNGFSVRKSKMIYSKKGEILQRTFVCHRQGYREDRGLSIESRKRVPKPETRCGCQAKFRVHIDIHSKRWRVTCFTNEHNHEVVRDQHCGLLAAHRVMKESDIMQMNNMLRVGIDASHIYYSFADQSGGYEKIGFRKKDLHNQIGKQRRLQKSDAKCALQYLRGLGSDDPMMFFRYTSDSSGRLQHLFWCDGICRIDYKVYGDVVAFDATYGKNKYHCPLVVFSGVNNHNNTIIFAGAIVADEKEETYVWVLTQFLEAMSGKPPSSVITDGDIAMKNAIKRVFPNAYHRLCAWHLIRNATSNIGDPAFVAEFRKCMLGDYEIGEFSRKWADVVDKFGLHDNSWIKEIYAKRKAWATAHIRGQLFAGFRTTSRCEGLHSEIGKFVHSRYNLSDFLLHYHRCLNYMRYKEVEADFASEYGEPVLQTRFHKLERFGAKVFTREIFQKLQVIINRSSSMAVTGCKETCGYYIYTIIKYRRPEREWHVSFNPIGDILRCSCRRMESFGLPCEHIITVLVFIHYVELPECLVLNRWRKNAKDGISSSSSCHPNFWDTHLATRYGALMFRWGKLSKLVCDNGDDYREHMEMAAEAIRKAEEKRGLISNITNIGENNVEENLQNPASCRTKGRRGVVGSSSGTRGHCSVCRGLGHNKTTCPQRSRGTQNNTVEDHLDPGVE